MNKPLLVNKTHLLDRNYVPKNLVETGNTEGEHLDPNHIIMVQKEVKEAFDKMALDAPTVMLIDSGYRSYDYQQQILDENIRLYGDAAYKKVALPGTSEHQTGLAIDYSFMIDDTYEVDVEKYPEYNKWIHENCYKYGFILRYPLGKEEITGYQYEPWHLRYVGECAKNIYESGKTLEEYLENK